MEGLISAQTSNTELLAYCLEITRFQKGHFSFVSTSDMAAPTTSSEFIPITRHELGDLDGGRKKNGRRCPRSGNFRVSL